VRRIPVCAFVLRLSCGRARAVQSQAGLGVYSGRFRNAWLGLLALACAAVCFGILGQVRSRGVQAHVLQEVGFRGGESLKALEKQKAQLQSFISKESGGPYVAVSSHSPEESDGDERGRGIQADTGARGKGCGKLCRRRKMILAVRRRIDSQAHIELQQLAVSPRLTSCHARQPLSVQEAVPPLASFCRLCVRAHLLFPGTRQ
jgi:hypothetical protein